MNKITTTAIALILGAASLATSVSAEIIGVYLRNDTGFVLVRTTDDGLMYCTRVNDGFEMCNGITEQEDGSWSGNAMKHPDMPEFMNFVGTVTVSENAILLEGCAIGNTRCLSESWPLQ